MSPPPSRLRSSVAYDLAERHRTPARPKRAANRSVRIMCVSSRIYIFPFAPVRAYRRHGRAVSFLDDAVHTLLDVSSVRFISVGGGGPKV
jgi:hypothetical protein